MEVTDSARIAASSCEQGGQQGGRGLHLPSLYGFARLSASTNW